MGKMKYMTAVSPSSINTRMGQRLQSQLVLVTVGLPAPSVIASGYFVWHSLRHSIEDFSSRRQRYDLQKAPQVPNTIDNSRLHTLSKTSTFIGNILPIQYGNGDTCFHEAVLVLESTQRATFHEEDGIVLDCLN